MRSKCGTKHGFKCISITCQLHAVMPNTLESNCSEWLKDSIVMKECCVPMLLEPYHGVIGTQGMQKSVAAQPKSKHKPSRHRVFKD